MRWKLRIAVSQLNAQYRDPYILHPTGFFPSPSKTKPPTLFSLKTPTAYVQTAKIPLHDLAIFAGWAHAIFGARVPA